MEYEMDREFNFDLQLFADPKSPPVVEVEEEELEEDVEDELEELDEVDEPDEEPDEPEAPPAAPPKKDKVTAAVIREKQANKVLRDKLAALERENVGREQDKLDNQYRQKLVNSGAYSEEDVEDKVQTRRENQEIKRELKSIKYGQQVDKLALKYPTIHEHLNDFIKIVEATNGAVSLTELCKARLDETTEQEIRTKTEQESLINRQKAKSKQVVTGEPKTAPSVRFSPEDETAFKYYAEKNPGKTRSDYAKILEFNTKI